MQEIPFSLSSSLSCLSRLFPPKGTIVVGAGMGYGVWFDLFRQRNVKDVLLIEAEQSNVQYLKKKYAYALKWRVLHEVVGDNDTGHNFFRLSNSAESGMIAPDLLKTLWPNISAKETQFRKTMTLDRLVHELNLTVNWLIVDVLSSLTILNGAKSAIRAFDVIIVRRVLDDHLSEGFREDIDAFMRQQEFICFGIEPERHPSLGHTVYVRDTQRQATELKLLQAQYKQLIHDVHERQVAWDKEKRELVKDSEAAVEQSASCQYRIDELTKSLKVAQQELDEEKLVEAELTERVKIITEQQDAKFHERQTAWEHEKKELEESREESKKLAEIQVVSQQQRIDQLTKSLREVLQELAEQKVVQAELTKRAKNDAEQQEVKFHQRQTAWEHKKKELEESREESEKLAEHKITSLQQCIEDLTQKLQAIRQELDERIQAHKKDLEQATINEDKREREFQSQSEQWLREKQELHQAHVLELGSVHEEMQQLRRNHEKWQATMELTLAKRNAFVEELKQTEKRLSNDLSKGLGNAVKQMEAFMGIQHYLQSGELLTNFHGWPISPDMGLFLLEKMHEQHYDLIIEFGSGTSTALLAKGVEVITRLKASKDGLTNVLGTEIVSFEHDKLFHDKTLQMLKSRGLSSMVQLEYTPLIEWQEGDDSYLFYDCKNKLASLAYKYTDRHLRILLLVDGPPNTTCRNARYPAVPLVFDAFWQHNIDVVLDDADRVDEKAVIKYWLKYWKNKRFDVKEVNVSSEKGLFYAISVPSNNK